MKKILPVAIIIAILLVGGAFYAGIKYSGTQRPAAADWQKGVNNFAKGAPGAGQGLNSGRAAGAGMISGEVIAKDDKSVTVKIKDGGSKIVIFAASTTVTKTAAGTMDDVAVGANVMIAGKTNADGSVTAETIQIRPDIAPSTQK